MLSPKARRNLFRILPFGIIWLVSGQVFSLVEWAAIGNAGAPAAGIEADFGIHVFAALAQTAVGLLVGATEVFYLGDAFANRSFSRKLVYKFVVYTLMLSVVTLITFPVAASMELDTNLLDRRVWDRLAQYLSSPTHLSTDVQLTIALGASLFYAEISEHIGHGVLTNLFKGKYHRPTEERRIFMFADMKASTTIAEALGHVTYFELLREYYADFADPIVRHAGEVYQYVGDEIVVSWEYADGVDHANCIRCFFAMKAALAERAEFYEATFGVAPTFKAGCHMGTVTTGEIGVLKKDIVFTGDVLNATARIQGLCNQYEVDLLLTRDVLVELALGPDFEVVHLGQSRVKGRQEALELYTLRQASSETGAN